MTGYKGRQGKTRGNKGDKERQELWRRRTHHPYEGAHGHTTGDKILQKANTQSMQRGTRGDRRRQEETRPWRRRTHHPYEGVQVQGEIKGDKGRQQGETREDKGRQDPGEGGHTIHVKGYKGRRGETRGDKTLEKADTLSSTKADTLRKYQAPRRKWFREKCHTPWKYRCYSVCL